MTTDADIIEEGHHLFDKVSKIADAYEMPGTIEHVSLICAILGCGMDNAFHAATEQAMKGKSKADKQEYILALINRVAGGMLQSGAGRYALSLGERMESFIDLVTSIEAETKRKRESHN